VNNKNLGRHNNLVPRVPSTIFRLVLCMPGHFGQHWGTDFLILVVGEDKIGPFWSREHPSVIWQRFAGLSCGLGGTAGLPAVSARLASRRANAAQTRPAPITFPQITQYPTNIKSRAIGKEHCRQASSATQHAYSVWGRSRQLATESEALP
jgi:hypothetical protein